jgi:hypothetical protein
MSLNWRGPRDSAEVQRPSLHHPCLAESKVCSGQGAAGAGSLAFFRGIYHDRYPVIYYGID